MMKNKVQEYQDDFIVRRDALIDHIIKDDMTAFKRSPGLLYEILRYGFTGYEVFSYEQLEQECIERGLKI